MRVADAYGRSAALRLAVELRQPAAHAAIRNGLDPALLQALLAIETHARGRAWRTFEGVLARLLLRLGLTARVERLSLGCAQIQPRRLSFGSIDDRIAVLLDPRSAIPIAAEVVKAEVHNLRLDAAHPMCWSEEMWKTMGLSYNGDAGYGLLLRAAYMQLA